MLLPLESKTHFLSFQIIHGKNGNSLSKSTQLGGGEQTKQLFPEEHLKRGGDEKTIILSPGTLFQNKIQHSKNVHK